MQLGYYDNFPSNIHHAEIYSSIVSIKQLQLRLIRVLGDLNLKEFTFEDIAIPTIPCGRVIFEFGLAESGGFNFIDEAEVKKALAFLSKGAVHSLDFFCSIRYYKENAEKRIALKFDYYMLRVLLSRGSFEVRISHERGPRYVSPKELSSFIAAKVNEAAGKKILREQAT